MWDVNAIVTQYEVGISEESFDAITDRDIHESDCKQLYEQLLEVDGVADVDYNGMFGSYIYLTICKEHDCADTWDKINKLIRDCASGD